MHDTSHQWTCDNKNNRRKNKKSIKVIKVITACIACIWNEETNTLTDKQDKSKQKRSHSEAHILGMLHKKLAATKFDLTSLTALPRMFKL